MRLYIAGAWIEQIERARPMMAKARALGISITYDWTDPLWKPSDGKGDSSLTPELRKSYAQSDLKGVLDADVFWLLAANDKGACGSWVELGAALAAVSYSRRLGRIIVSGPQWQRCIFSELADRKFPTDDEAFDYLRSLLEEELKA